MKILFLTHYFPPEVNAPASRTFEHCSRWLRAGHDVTVITCTPNCPNGVVFDGHSNSLLPHKENIDGIKVVRVWSYLTPNRGVRRRILNYLSYAAMAVVVGLRVERPDVVVATSPQFFCGWAGVFIKWLRGTPLVLEIRDIWPESIRAVGAMRNKWLIRILEKLELWMYRAATRIVTVGKGYKKNIVRKVGTIVPVSVISNGVDLERFHPRPPDTKLIAQWDLADRFVCSYIGTIGMAHGLDVVVSAASMIRDMGRTDICFCIVGDGAEGKRLRDLVTSEDLGNYVVFTGRTPRADIPSILSVTDVSLIHLRSCKLFDSVIPSKVFESMAAGRPILMGVAGDALDIVNDAGAGVPMQPGSAESLVECLIDLADDREKCGSLGRAGRRYVEQHFDRNLLADRMLDILKTECGFSNESRQADSCPNASPDEVTTDSNNAAEESAVQPSA